MKLKKIGLMLLVAFALILTACGKSQSQNGKLKVMTTFYPVYDFTKNCIMLCALTILLTQAKEQENVLIF